MIRNGRPDAEVLVFTMALPIAFAIWLAAIRLDISENQIAYRSLFGRARTVCRADVLSIGASAFSPTSGEPISVNVRLKGGGGFEINARPLSREAVLRLLRWTEPNNSMHATYEDARA